MTLNETIAYVNDAILNAKVPDLNRVVAFPCDDDGYSAEYQELLIAMVVNNYLETQDE